MGNSQSTRIFDGSEFLQIECFSRIEDSDFQKMIQSGVTEKDRRELRGGMTLLGEHPSWLWKNAVVRCIGDNIDYCFWSGSSTNRFVVCLNESDEVNKQCNSSGWALRLYNGFIQVWGMLKQLAPLVAPAALKAITRK